MREDDSMNRKILMKIFIVFILIIFTVNITNTHASALGDVLSGGKQFIESGEGHATSIDTDKLKNTSNSIYNILLMVSFVVVAAVGITLGIKYMMAGVDDKADVKNSLIVFIIGCLVIYGSYGIWRVLVNFLNGAFLN